MAKHSQAVTTPGKTPTQTDDSSILPSAKTEPQQMLAECRV